MPPEWEGGLTVSRPLGWHSPALPRSRSWRASPPRATCRMPSAPCSPRARQMRRPWCRAASASSTSRLRPPRWRPAPMSSMRARSIACCSRESAPRLRSARSRSSISRPEPSLPERARRDRSTRRQRSGCGLLSRAARACPPLRCSDSRGLLTIASCASASRSPGTRSGSSSRRSRFSVHWERLRARRAGSASRSTSTARNRRSR